MRAFEYARPRTLDEAARLLADAAPEAALLAGGTDLLALVKDGVVSPKRVVSLRDVEGLRGVRREESGEIRIGATTTLEQVADDPTVRRDLPALRDAIEAIRSAQILSMATVGGNLCQRPQCWYFRAGFGLLARKDGRSLVLDGDDRHHAILGNEGPAYFTAPSSLAVVLIVLGASVRLVGARGKRDLPLARFYRIPRSEAEREHDLAADEIVAEVRIPGAAGRRSAFYEVRGREGLDWPMASAAVSIGLTGGSVSTARVVLGHVAPVPWLAEKAADALVGRKLDAASAARAAESALAGARPLRRNGYKVQLARVAVRRALLAAMDGGAGR